MQKNLYLVVMLAAEKNGGMDKEVGLEMILTNRCSAREKRVNGMTLIELVIVVALVATLASIALPNYQQHLLRAQRIAAMADLAKLQIELERHYTTSYISAAQAVMPHSVCQLCRVDKQRFRIAVTAREHSYQITAQPLGEQRQDSCQGEQYNQLTLNQAGLVTPANCWH